MYLNKYCIKEVWSMKNSNKAMLAGLAAGIGLGYMAAKKQHDSHKSTYTKILDMIKEQVE